MNISGPNFVIPEVDGRCDQVSYLPLGVHFLASSTRHFQLFLNCHTISGSTSNHLLTNVSLYLASCVTARLPQQAYSPQITFSFNDGPTGKRDRTASRSDLRTINVTFERLITRMPCFILAYLRSSHHTKAKLPWPRDTTMRGMSPSMLLRL